MKHILLIAFFATVALGGFAQGKVNPGIITKKLNADVEGEYIYVITDMKTGKLYETAPVTVEFLFGEQIEIRLISSTRNCNANGDVLIKKKDFTKVIFGKICSD